MDESKLERLVIDNPAFDQLDAAMDVFCPFDAVGMSRQEVRHGHFLQYVLDPARPHGFGAECLRAFMRAVAGTLAGNGLGIAPLDVHLMDLDGAVVRREYQAIDLLIEIPRERLVIAIELKIDASEHSGQLGRYRRIVEHDWPGHRHLLLFLTKRGDAPSAKDGAGWHALPLSPVADALAGVTERQVGQADARMMLAAYVGMLRRDHLTDDRLEQLAAGLWREHREALEFLMERRPGMRYAILGQLLDRQGEIAAKLSALTALQIVPDRSTKSQVFFGIADWDDVPGMISLDPTDRRMVTLYISEDRGTTKAQFQLRPGTNRQAVFNALEAVGADVGGSRKLGMKYRQLANTTLASDEDDAEDIDELVVRLAGFVNAHKDKYTQAMASLMGR